MTDEVERIFDELAAIKRPNHGPEYLLKSTIRAVCLPCQTSCRL